MKEGETKTGTESSRPGTDLRGLGEGSGGGGGIGGEAPAGEAEDPSARRAAPPPYLAGAVPGGAILGMPSRGEGQHQRTCRRPGESARHAPGGGDDPADHARGPYGRAAQRDVARETQEPPGAGASRAEPEGQLLHPPRMLHSPSVNQVFAPVPGAQEPAGASDDRRESPPLPFLSDEGAYREWR